MRVTELWKAGLCGKSLFLRLHHDGCARSQAPMILSSMAVCEEGGFGVSPLLAGLLAYGWSGVGVASQVVGRAGKEEEL